MAAAITAAAPITAHADAQRPAAAADWPESGSFLRFAKNTAVNKFEASSKGTYEMTGIHPDLFQPIGIAHVKAMWQTTPRAISAAPSHSSASLIAPPTETCRPP